MSFIELAKKRRSIRSYQNRPVEREKLDRCLQAAQVSPSACNSQPWSFIVVDNMELKNQIAYQTFNKIFSFNQFTTQAPVIIAAVAEKAKLSSVLGGFVRRKKFPIMDIAIACEHICLQAVDEGLGACMIGWFHEKKVKQILEVPSSKRVILLITIGYPKEVQIAPKKIKSLETIRSYNNAL